MTDDVVDLRAWRRRLDDPESRAISTDEIRRAEFCAGVIEVLAASEHPLTADPAALMELLEVLQLSRTAPRAAPVGG